jgi:hypothetical protein
MTASRSERAAMWLAEHGGSMHDAGAQFGISHQAVSQAWERLFGDDKSPLLITRSEIATRVLALAREGKTRSQIVAATGVAMRSVYRICRNAGVAVVTASEVRRRRYDDACAEVTAGRCLVDVAIDHRVSRGALTRELRRRGIQAKRAQTGRQDGRTARAIERVRAGAQIVVACAIERVATPNVYRAFRRRDTNPGGANV